MYKIVVKQWMTKKATPEFDFMAKWNNNEPMPLRIMVGEKLQETPGMIKMSLHGDILEEKTQFCMKCGRPITNLVSQYFGMGPECGSHNYVNPFNSEEELKQSVNAYRQQIREIKWEGWIIKSAIQEMELIDDEEDTEITTMPQQEDVGINIEVKESDLYTLEDGAAFVSFKYDADLVELMRSIPIRYYHKDTKEWEVPTDKIEYIKSNTSKTVKISGVANDNNVDSNYIPKEFSFTTQPFSHQIDGINYGLTHTNWILGDEMGLGKTKQIIDLAVCNKIKYAYKHCLIICCVNGLKWNWYYEVQKHSKEKAYILGSRKVGGKIVVKNNAEKFEDVRNLDKIDDYFIITNIETLRNDDIVTELKKLCQDGTIGMIAVDECHKCANPTSQQSKGLFQLSAKNKIMMSGTPLLNKPLDLYTPLKWLGFENHAFYSFKNHHCIFGGFGGHEIQGYKNLEELQEKLNKIMLRRLKTEVLDLPEKIYIDEYVDLTPNQQKIYKEVYAQIKEDIDMIKVAPNPLAQLTRLRQATGYTGILYSTIKESAKLDRLQELVEEHIENDKKVVVFSNWTQMTGIIQEQLKSYKPAVITGELSIAERKVQEDRFQNDNNCKVIIGTIGAMGTGLTLTAGTVIIFVDEPWNKATYEQAVDRCHRIGTKENITIYNLIAKDTIDERIHEIIYKKGLMSDMLVDGNMSNREIFDIIIN